MPRPRPKCGTNGGYLAHRRRDEDPCGPCKAAHAQLARNDRVAAGATARPKGPAHGTRAAYERERRAFKAERGPAPCEVCIAANSAARR